MHPSNPWLSRQIIAAHHREEISRANVRRMIASARSPELVKIGGVRRALGGALIGIGERLNPEERSCEPVDSVSGLNLAR
jgi:hypothetical protein